MADGQTGGGSLAIADDIARMKQQFKALGYYERPTLRMVGMFVLYIAVGLAAMIAYLHFHGVLLRVGLLLLSTLSLLGSITLAHTAAHGAASRSSWVNDLLTYIANPILHQLSARYWVHSHVTVHHPAPNVIGHDDDCDLRPFFVLNEEHARQGGLMRKLLLPLQGILMPLMLPLNGINMQRHGWGFLMIQAWKGKWREKGLWVDVACMLTHIGLFVALPMLWFSPVDVLVFYFARVTLAGSLLFAILAPGHFPESAVVLSEDQRNAGDFYLRQTASTVNFRTGAIGELLTNGLQYQIEHHLFPSINHVHLGRVQPHVKAFCARHGLPYHEAAWLKAIWESYVVFIRPKRVCYDVETCRAPIRVETAAATAADESPCATVAGAL